MSIKNKENKRYIFDVIRKRPAPHSRGMGTTTLHSILIAGKEVPGESHQCREIHSSLWANETLRHYRVYAQG